MKKKYLTEEERLEARKESQRKWREANSEYKKQWYQANREKMLEYDKQYKQTNREKLAEYHKQYNKTQMGRAVYLVNNYAQSDKKYSRGECTLTAQWIIENIFNSKCHYCEESDWTKLGCDRVDNSKPHTEDNVVCCCEECNTKRGTKSYEDFLVLINI